MKQIPTQRAEVFYQPPPQMRADAWTLVPPAERVWRWFEHQVQRRLVPPAGVLLGEELYARINHNRWVADCPCGSAQVVTPEDPRFACPECGYGWAQIRFPTKPADAEAEVAARAPHERNWWNDDDDTTWDRPTRPEPVKEQPVPQPEEPVPGVPEQPVPPKDPDLPTTKGSRS